ncbi:MAG: hypothetical protein SO054_08475 [Ruminococcus callidus]|nr:hypothetical protein [Ruminococcus callidus]
MGNTAQSLCVRCVVRFFGRLPRNSAGILPYGKGFLGNMTENLHADCVQSRQAGFVRYCPWSRNANASFSYKEVHPLAAAFPPVPSLPQQLLWTTCKYHRNCTISVVFILPYYWNKIKGNTERLHTSLSGDFAVQTFPDICFACAPVNYF